MIRYTLLLSVILSTPIVANSEGTLIVENGRLELVRKYNITGSDFDIEFEETGLSSTLDVDEDVIPFLLNQLLSHLYEDTFGSDSLLYIDSNGNIVDIVVENESNIIPLGNSGKYIREFNPTVGSEWVGYSERELVDIKTGSITPIAVSGEYGLPYVNPFEENDGYTISYLMNVYEYGCRKIEIFDPDGNVVSEIDGITNNLLSVCSPFNKDKDWLIAVDSQVVNRERLPNIGRGTKIFDSNGSLRLTLRPNIYCRTSGMNIRDDIFYGSDSYICQIGYDARLNSIGEIEKYRAFRDRCRLEVYSGEGAFLWEYNVPYRVDDMSISVSDNEEYICFLHGRDASILSLNNGALIYEIYDDIGGWIKNAYISNDGSVVALSKDKYLNGLCHNYVVLYEDGRKIGEVLSPYEDTSSQIFLDDSGSSFIYNIGSNVFLYRIELKPKKEH